MAPLILHFGTRQLSGQLHAPDGLLPGRNTGTQLIGGWLGLASLDSFGEEKVSYPTGFFFFDPFCTF